MMDTRRLQMAKRKLVFQAKARKGVTVSKQGVMENLAIATAIELIETGKFDDGSEYLTVRIIVK